jgi:hypothetical protein
MEVAQWIAAQWIAAGREEAARGELDRSGSGWPASRANEASATGRPSPCGPSSLCPRVPVSSCAARVLTFNSSRTHGDDLRSEQWAREIGRFPIPAQPAAPRRHRNAIDPSILLFLRQKRRSRSRGWNMDPAIRVKGRPALSIGVGPQDLSCGVGWGLGSSRGVCVPVTCPAGCWVVKTVTQKDKRRGGVEPQPLTARICGTFSMLATC